MDKVSHQAKLIGFIFKGMFLEIKVKVKSSSFSLRREENKWIWKMLQRDYQQDLIQCQNEGIRREEKKKKKTHAYPLILHTL